MGRRIRGLLIDLDGTVHTEAGAVQVWVPGAAEALRAVRGDLESDVVGARRAGLTGVLVRTGKFARDDRSEADAREHADAVLGSLAELPGWLGSG